MDAMRTPLAVAITLLAFLATPAADAKPRSTLKTTSDGTVTMEWPKYTCPDPDLEIDPDPDERWEPADVRAGDAPTFEFEDSPDVIDEGEAATGDDAAEEPTITVQPWRARYYPDGSYELWHDERCIPEDVDALLGLGDPMAEDLAEATREGARARARAAASAARRKSLR